MILAVLQLVACDYPLLSVYQPWRWSGNYIVVLVADVSFSLGTTSLMLPFHSGIQLNHLVRGLICIDIEVLIIWAPVGQGFEYLL